MPRALSLRSRERIQDRAARTPRALGSILGVAMLAGNVPASALAKRLRVSSDTVYRWIYEDEVSLAYQDHVKEIVEVLKGEAALKGTVAERTRQFNRLMKAR